MRTLRLDRLLDLVDRLYEAAARPELWREVLHDVADIAGGEGAILFHSKVERTPQILHSESMTPAITAFVRDGWYMHNVRVRRGLAVQRRGHPIVTEELLFEREEYARDPMHMELLRPHGLGHFVGLTIAHTGAADILLSIERSGRAEPYSRQDIQGLAQVLPHIRRAGQLALSVSLTHGQGMLDAFALLDRPALLLDAFGSALRVNVAAERLFSPDLFIRDGMLVARDRVVNSGLHRLIGEVLGDSAEALVPCAPVPVPRTLGRPLVVHGAPLVGSARDPFQAAKAILTIVDPEEGRDLGEILLQQACGLTAAEANTALHLARGLSLEQIAEARGVGIETTRWQVKSIAEKVDTHGRGALVALLNRILFGLIRRERATTRPMRSLSPMER